MIFDWDFLVCVPCLSMRIGVCVLSRPLRVWKGAVRGLVLSLCWVWVLESGFILGRWERGCGGLSFRQADNNVRMLVLLTS